MIIVKKIQPKIVIFTAMKNRCMLLLHGHVFVMLRSYASNMHFYCMHMQKASFLMTWLDEYWLFFFKKSNTCTSVPL